MIKIENIDVYGWEAAIRGARNPMNSWGRMDTCYNNGEFEIGENDYKLLKNLTIAGPEHRKWNRMVTVTMDITAPLYFFKEYDTYKVGTVANSCSTMHKIQAGYDMVIQRNMQLSILLLLRQTYSLHDFSKGEIMLRSQKGVNCTILFYK